MKKKIKLKEYAIFRNGTQQGSIMAKSFKEAKQKVIAQCGDENRYQIELID